MSSAYRLLRFCLILCVPAQASSLNIQRQGSEISLQWASRPGQFFDIQRSDHLSGWTDHLRGFPAGSHGSITTVVLENSGLPKAFFRVGPPLAKARILRFESAGPMFSITWSSQPGEFFDIEVSDKLAGWRTLHSAIPSSAGGLTSTFTFAKPSAGSFFRVVSAKSRPRISHVAWLGDSITAGETEADGRAHLLTGRLVHTLLEQRITPVPNQYRGDWDFGWSGFTSQQLIEGRPDLPGVEPVQSVIESGADACVVHIGTNNITWRQAVGTIVASITRVWDLLRSANIITIGTEITPLHGSSSVATVDDINRRLKAEAQSRGMIFVEWNKVGRLPDGTADPHYYMDGVHPNAIAASEKAMILADQLSREATLPERPVFPPPDSPDWLTANPAMVSPAGGLAVSWGSSAPEGGTVEFSTVPAVDGGGPWRQVVVRQPLAGYRQGYLHVSAKRTLRAGERFFGTLEMESLDDWNFKEVSISMGNVGGNPRDLYVGGRGGIEELGGPVARYQGILKTPVLTVSEDHSGKGTFFIHFWGSGTLRFRNAGIRLVP